METFVAVCSSRGVKLLLPDPTEREVKRHIKTRSLDALKALEEARRKAPFLSKWKGLPQSPRSPKVEELEVHRVATLEWSAFLKQFTVVKLGYDKLDMAKVMGWYDRADAPFREGKKRKEFPDALAIALIDAYARENKTYVAVVSADNDLKEACARFGALLYFASLPRLTEVLLSDDVRLETARRVLNAGTDLITKAILDEGVWLGAHHTNDRFEINGLTCLDVDMIDLSIVALGDGECTVTFIATLALEVELQWQDSDEDGYVTHRMDVNDAGVVSGTAKVAFDATNATVSAVTFIELDDTDIEITETPRGW